MKSLHATFISAIASGTVKLTELFTIELAAGNIYRYTSFDKSITWDAAGNAYSPSWPAERNPAQLGIDSGSDSVRLTLANIIGELATKIKKNMLDGATVTIKRIRWDDTYASNKEIVLFVGTIRVTYNRSESTFEILPFEETGAIKFPPHTFQEPCNNTIFDKWCGLNQFDYEYYGTATGGSETTLVDAVRETVYDVDFDGGDSDNPIEIGDTITGQVGAGTAKVLNIIYSTEMTGTIWYAELSGLQFVDDEEIQNTDSDSIIVNGTPAADTSELGFYEKGELEMLTGNNAGLRAEILSNTGDTITIFGKFPYPIANGDTYKIIPGCKYKSSICQNVYHNEANFAGFLYVPKIEETMM